MPYAFEGGICTDPRDGALEITETQYSEALTAILGGQTVSVVGGFSIVAAPEQEEEDPYADLELGQWKVKLLEKIDADAETARLRYITGGSGQAMTYQQKAQEAASVLLDENPSVETYPLLSAEIGITAATLPEVAAVVNAAYQGWRVVGAKIEAFRLGGKAAVSSAQTIEAAKQAAAIEWP
ncbi:hypothetical protein CFBP6626_07175 [Agrobacterium tumefaciens]|nr:hypothetical protein CFBP6626_07175 [Agrobacterium tumefaciens]CUX21264.1 hypothetical protein AGR5A_Cc190150 [Agrobacterium genomosp. 5 str. CFBP 6626]